MHPAYSVILFTTASGAGYGLLVWLAVAALLATVPTEAPLGLLGFGLAFALIIGDLLSSTAHLGRPERAWRAFSQWRTSWLSREGVVAVATFVPAGLLGIGWVFLEHISGVFALAALAAIVCAVLTLYTTGMIYASLRTVPQWHQPLTAPIYIVLGLASGAALLNLGLHVLGRSGAWSIWLALACLGLGLVLKVAYWKAIDGTGKQHTVEAATGLGQFGKVRVLEGAHAQPNFVMREMGYRIARAHSLTLRKWIIWCGFALPIALTLASLIPSRFVGVAAALLTVAASAVGIVLERWLFFAEAEHVVRLYYGADRA
jgi:DMSO reductase anchor subunit